MGEFLKAIDWQLLSRRWIIQADYPLRLSQADYKAFAKLTASKIQQAQERAYYFHTPPSSQDFTSFSVHRLKRVDKQVGDSDK